MMVMMWRKEVEERYGGKSKDMAGSRKIWREVERYSELQNHYLYLNHGHFLSSSSPTHLRHQRRDQYLVRIENKGRIFTFMNYGHGDRGLYHSGAQQCQQQQLVDNRQHFDRRDTPMAIIFVRVRDSQDDDDCRRCRNGAEGVVVLQREW
jgi:hypothetical protein